MIARVERYDTATAMHHAAAKSIISSLEKAIASRGSASLVLSGGSTPKAIYKLLAAMEADWRSVRLFWGDERCVPPTDADSNYRMTHEVLLTHLAISESNVFRIEGELDPILAAERYSTRLQNEFGLVHRELPVFDLVLLGLGEDGHTASLFPGTSILSETRRLVAEVYVPRLRTHRISMTFPLLNNAREILFLVSGSGKAGIVHEVLEGLPDRYPAQHVAPVNGTLRWLMDAEAATLLQSTEFHQQRSFTT